VNSIVQLPVGYSKSTEIEHNPLAFYRTICRSRRVHGIAHSMAQGGQARSMACLCHGTTQYHAGYIAELGSFSIMGTKPGGLVLLYRALPPDEIEENKP
jgi:hypothetical protein